MDTAEQIKSYIAKGKSEEAVKLLLSYTKENIPGLHDEALLLSGQYRQWKRGITLGVEQSSSELRRIEMSIMDLLNDKETYSETTSRTPRVAAATNNPSAQKSNLTSILLGVFGTISIGFVLILFLGGEAPVAQNGAGPGVSEVAAMSVVPKPKTNKTVSDGGLTEENFDNMLASYDNSMAETGPVLDIKNVIQVRYTDGEKNGAFESVAGSTEWIQRNETTNEILFRYQEISRDNRTIVLYDKALDRTRFLAIDEDKVYEQVQTFTKVHVFNIIGIY